MSKNLNGQRQDDESRRSTVLNHHVCFSSGEKTSIKGAGKDGQKAPVRLGLYDVGRTIGKGNFAIVKLSRHRVTKTEVAIKIIDKTRLDGSNLQKVYREIGILKTLNHTNIIKLFQVMETKNMLYLVTEYAPNGEIFDYIARHGRLSENEARRIFQQIISAVDYCHSVIGVCHRDLKAENLLLDADWQIKLADFGFSNYYTKDDALATFCGSPPYAAPEVFEGKKYYGPEIDIWSLGVILYVLVCGALPFDAPNLPLLRDRVLSGRYRIPYFMSSDCENLLRKLLVIEPSKRFTLEQIKLHRWMKPLASIGRHLSEISLNKQQCDWSRFEEPFEPVLKLMESLGIDSNKTKESLRRKAFDNFTAIYLLLMDRWRSESSGKRQSLCLNKGDVQTPANAVGHRPKRRSPAVGQTHGFASFYKTVDSIGTPQGAGRPLNHHNAASDATAALTQSIRGGPMSGHSSDGDTSSMTSDSGIDFNFSDTACSFSRQSTIPNAGQFSLSLDDPVPSPLAAALQSQHESDAVRETVIREQQQHWQKSYDSTHEQLCGHFFSPAHSASIDSCTNCFPAADSTTSLAILNGVAVISSSSSSSAATTESPPPVTLFDSFDSQTEYDFMASLSSYSPGRLWDQQQQQHHQALYKQSPATCYRQQMSAGATGYLGSTVQATTSGSFSVDSAPCQPHLFKTLDTPCSYSTTTAADCPCVTTWSVRGEPNWGTPMTRSLRSSDAAMVSNFDANFAHLTPNDRTRGLFDLNENGRLVQGSPLLDFESNKILRQQECLADQTAVKNGQNLGLSPELVSLNQGLFSPLPNHFGNFAKRTNLSEKLEYHPLKLLTMKQSRQIEQQFEKGAGVVTTTTNCVVVDQASTHFSMPAEVVVGSGTSTPISNNSKLALLHQQRLQTFHQKKQQIIHSRRQQFVRQVSYQLAQSQSVMPGQSEIMDDASLQTEQDSEIRDYAIGNFINAGSPPIRANQSKLLHLSTDMNFKAVEPVGLGASCHVIPTPLSPIEDTQFGDKEFGDELMDTT